MGKIFPIYVAGLGIEGIVGTHATVAGPGLEGKECSDFLQLAVLVGPGSEIRPDGNHKLGIVVVDVADHLFGNPLLLSPILLI